MHKKLKEAVLKDELIIFIGAGVSIPFDFPSWTNLIIDILKELKEEDTKSINLDYYIEQGNKLDVFKVLDDLEREGFKPKVKQLLHAKITEKNNELEGKDFSRIEKIWEISNKIITTNYDSVFGRSKTQEDRVFL